VKKQHIVVGLSGGVDSAVSAYLLKQAGHEVVGLFMKNWEDDDRPADAQAEDPGHCTSAIDFVDAAAVADVLGIEIEHVNFAAEYKDRVFAEFLREYQAGRTPNPDVLCNAEIKFKSFLDHAIDLGATRIATGHYAKVVQKGELFELHRAADAAKDQSYFLHRLTQAQLSRVVFPLEDLVKSEVRQIAAEARLPNHAKKDSTGICFIGERPFRDFLKRYVAREPGPIRTPEGRQVGEHMGLAFYTIGQRKGIGIGGTRGAESEAWYVAQKDLGENTLVVVQGHDHPLLMKRTLAAQDASWISGDAPIEGATHSGKTRYRQQDSTCFVTRSQDDEIALEFAQPQWAVTPGQSVVLYDGDQCLGGAVIA